MITALSGIAPEWFIPPAQDGESETRFQLKPLSGMRHAEMYATCTIEDGMVGLSGQTVQLCIKYGLIGWDNFSDEKGEIIEFSQALIGRVPGTVLFMIASRIFTISMLSESDKKK